MLGVVEPASVYCCVKSFVRDVQLQQPPVLCLRPEQLQRLDGPFPRTLLEQRPLKEKEILDVVQLSSCCEKYEMHRAARALKAYVRNRYYTVPALTWLQRQGHRASNVHKMQ